MRIGGLYYDGAKGCENWNINWHQITVALYTIHGIWFGFHAHFQWSEDPRMCPHEMNWGGGCEEDLATLALPPSRHPNVEGKNSAGCVVS